MDLNKTGKRAYNSAHQRYKISGTNDVEEQHKEATRGLRDEFAEFLDASEINPSDHLSQYSEAVEELADMILVSLTELHRRGINIEELLHAKMKFNESRGI